MSKKCAVVARSTFPSQNVQNLGGRTAFGSCGTKHISKSKCTKHTMLRPLLEVKMSKKCTPLWREAHFQVKSVKSWRVRTTFGRSKCQNWGVRTTFWRSDVDSNSNTINNNNNNNNNNNYYYYYYYYSYCYYYYYYYYYSCYYYYYYFY